MVVDDIGYMRKKNNFVDAINNPEKFYLPSYDMTRTSVNSSILHIYVVSQICLFMRSSIAKTK